MVLIVLLIALVYSARPLLMLLSSSWVALVYSTSSAKAYIAHARNICSIQSTTAATINALLKSYNGMRLGFKLKK